MIAAVGCRSRRPRIQPPESRSLDADSRLMKQVQAGDEDAFRELLERNYPRVLGLASRFGQDRAQAEEIAQETFLRLFQSQDRYQPERGFRAYLYRIAVNLCHSRFRRRKVARAHQDAACSSCPEPAGEPLSDLLREELRTRVREAVDRLPERQRMAVLLQRFEGLSYEEVGEALGLSLPATKSLLHRARLSLREMLVEYQAA